MKIIALAYDSDTHCVDCASQLHGQSVLMPGATGFESGVIFDTDERINDLYCGTCRELIAASTLETT